MKKYYFLIALVVFGLLSACSGKTTHHKSAMPDPHTFNAHFGDMYTSGDDLVNWEEFKAHFPNGAPNVFKEIDLNQDKTLDHDEWHAFKEAHGLKHHE